MKKLVTLLTAVFGVSLFVGCGGDNFSKQDKIILIVEGSITEDECTEELVDASFLTIGKFEGATYHQGSANCDNYTGYKDCKIADINGYVGDLGHCVSELIPE
jgi:hypothetical protein